MLMPEARPYVHFHYEEREDRNATIENGIYTPKNVAMVEITPVGGKNVHVDEAEGWLRKIREASTQGRYPRDWVRDFEQMFQMFKEGEEIPETGIAIRSCLMFSPAEQKAILNANVRTLEDLCACGEDALAAMGPGGRALRDRARTAVAQSQDAGKTAREIEALKVENEALRQRVDDLIAGMERSSTEQTKRGPGRPPKAESA